LLQNYLINRRKLDLEKMIYFLQFIYQINQNYNLYAIFLILFMDYITMDLAYLIFIYFKHLIYFFNCFF